MSWRGKVPVSDYFLSMSKGLMMSVPDHTSGNANQTNAALLFPVGPYLSAGFTKIHKTFFLVTPATKDLQHEATHISFETKLWISPQNCETQMMSTGISAKTSRDLCRNYVEADRKLRKENAGMSVFSMAVPKSQTLWIAVIWNMFIWWTVSLKRLLQLVHPLFSITKEGL